MKKKGKKESSHFNFGSKSLMCLLSDCRSRKCKQQRQHIV